MTTFSARSTSPWVVAGLIALMLLAAPATQAMQPGWLDQARAHLQAAAAESFPNHRVQATLRPLDSRIVLKECANPRFSRPGGTQAAGGRVSLKVQCSEPETWTLYLPAEVQISAEVAVLTRPLRRGDLVSNADVRWQLLDVSSTPDAVDRSGNLLGAANLVARRHLSAGTVLRASMIERPLAVRRGERVSIVSARPGLTIESIGVALANARAGDAVQVRNVSSQRLVQAWASAPGVVSTTPPAADFSQAQAKVSQATGR